VTGWGWSPDNDRIRARSPPDGDGLGNLAALAGVRDYPGRVKCATLIWRALRSGIEGR
jgi:NifU-like protein involved in Fe-S cluster formation